MKKLEFTIESRDGNKTPVYCVKWMPDGRQWSFRSSTAWLSMLAGMSHSRSG